MKSQLSFLLLPPSRPITASCASSFLMTRSLCTRSKLLLGPRNGLSSRRTPAWLSSCRSTPRNCSRPAILPQSKWYRNASSQPSPSKSSADARNVTTVPTTPTAILQHSRPHENIYTLPNILTFSRLLAAPAVGYFILNAQPHLALGLFAYAGLTDLVDGYLARRFHSQTVVGTVIDPMADKALMTVSVVCLACLPAGGGGIPVWLAVVILGRDIALAVSAIYFRWISLPAPKTMARYWDFSLPSAEVRPTEISKINTFLQLLFVGAAMTLPVLPVALVEAANLHGVFEGFQYLVAGTTVWSGTSYLYNKDAVKILTAGEIEERMQKGEEGEKESQA